MNNEENNVAELLDLYLGNAEGVELKQRVAELRAHLEHFKDEPLIDCRVIQHENGVALSIYRLPNCPDCGTAPDQPHTDDCDVQRCSICGTQRVTCNCKNHDPLKSVWTGEWPTTAKQSNDDLACNGDGFVITNTVYVLTEETYKMQVIREIANGELSTAEISELVAGFLREEMFAELVELIEGVAAYNRRSQR